jgi:hypothetical protein
MDIETLHIGRFFETMEDVDAYVQQLRQVFFYPLVVQKCSVSAQNKKVSKLDLNLLFKKYRTLTDSQNSQGQRWLTMNAGNIILPRFFVCIMEIIQTGRKDCALIRKSTHAIVHIHGMSL